jgi:hypothetical protein
MFLTQYQLNEVYSLHVCSWNDDNAINGRDFDANKEWVITEDLGERFDTCIQYTTKSAKRFNFPFKAENPKAAIQQVLTYAYTGKAKKLSEMWFQIVKNN